MTPLDERPISPPKPRFGGGTQPLQSTPRPRPRPAVISTVLAGQTFHTCPYCRQKVSADNKRHELSECPAANIFFDPGPDESFSRASPLARRAVALSKVRPPVESPLQR